MRKLKESFGLFYLKVVWLCARNRLFFATTCWTVCFITQFLSAIRHWQNIRISGRLHPDSEVFPLPESANRNLHIQRCDARCNYGRIPSIFIKCAIVQWNYRRTVACTSAQRKRAVRLRLAGCSAPACCCRKEENAEQFTALNLLMLHYDLDTVTGLSEFDRRQVCVPKACPKTCARKDTCLYHIYLRQAQTGTGMIRICNHNYLLADAEHRQQGGHPLLKEYGILQ